MDRSKLGQQRGQTPVDQGGRQRRDVGARSLDLGDDVPVGAQPRSAAGTPDVYA